MWRRSKDGTGTWGNWIQSVLVGDYGIGSTALIGAPQASDANSTDTNGFTAAPGSTGVNYFSNFAPMLTMTRAGGNDSTGMIGQIQVTPQTMAFRARELNSWTSWRTIYHSGNTTKGSDGTLKAASPIVKIFHDGHSETNDESEGCTVTRLGVGQYLLENCIGMNADASWGGINGGFDIPKDRNEQPLIWLDFEVNTDGSVLVKTYHRTYPDAPEFAQNIIESITDGEPVDIPVDQFVSVRVEMPQDSIWNQKQEAIQAESEAELADQEVVQVHQE